ncbi:MAG TPA: DUF3147 family protein [Edaphobacter sp.]
MSELIIRFLVGGIVVSLFALLGDVLRPKSFAGLFGAAPSIALATIGLTIARKGPQYAAIEARSMMLGAVGFFTYAVCVRWMLVRYKPATLVATISLIPVWLVTSFALWYLFVRSS